MSFRYDAPDLAKAGLAVTDILLYKSFAAREPLEETVSVHCSREQLGQREREAAAGRSAIRKIYWRRLPVAILTYLLAYIDRINVGFAALTMRTDLHMSATDFGFASGIFFWSYFIFEVPSNIIM